MKKILSVFIIFNSINAGMGSSKPQTLQDSRVSSEQDLVLSKEEQEILQKVLSNPTVLEFVQNKLKNSQNNKENLNSNLNNLNNIQNPAGVPANFTINFNANQNSVNSSSNSSINSNEINISLVQKLYNYLKTYSKATGSFLYRHKGKIILIIIAIICAVLFYKLVVLKYALTGAQCLTNCWQSGKSLSDIIQISAPELTRDLFQTMGTKFASPQAMANCSIPMTEFVKAITAEKSALATYAKIGSVLTALGIGSLFAVDKTIVNSYEERMGKLNYMQKLFEEFIAKKCGDSLVSGNF